MEQDNKYCIDDGAKVDSNAVLYVEYAKTLHIEEAWALQYS